MNILAGFFRSQIQLSFEVLSVVFCNAIMQIVYIYIYIYIKVSLLACICFIHLHTKKQIVLVSSKFPLCGEKPHSLSSYCGSRIFTKIMTVEVEITSTSIILSRTVQLSHVKDKFKLQLTKRSSVQVF